VMREHRIISRVRRALRTGRETVEREVADEISFHLDSRIEALRSHGHSEAEARRIALSEFGDIRASYEELSSLDRRRRRRSGLSEFVDTLAQDVRHAARSLRRSPVFMASGIVTLALGIGAVVTAFAVVNAVLLRPLPYKNSARLVGAWYDMPAINLYHVGQAIPTYYTYRDLASTIEDIGIYQETFTNVADADGSAPPQRLSTALASASLFSVLGASPMTGRLVSMTDDRPGAAPVVLISDALWHARYGADPHAVGTMLDVNGVHRQIIGVMRASFQIPSAETALWIPLNIDPLNPPGDAFAYNAIARLKPGVSRAQAQREFAALLPRAGELYPRFVPGITTRMIMDQVKPRAVLTSLSDDVTGGIAGTLWVIAAAASLLFFVAIVNVANLTLVRGDARQRELAVRAALGAGRMRLVRHHVVESLVLAAYGAAIALVLAWATVHLLVAHGPSNVPRLQEIRLDGATVGFAVALSLAAAAACSAIPALRILRDRNRFGLLRSMRGGTAARRQQIVRGALVIGQIAIGAVVLASSGLLLRSFERLQSVQPGYDAQHVSTAWTSLPRARYASNVDVVRFYAELVARVARLPGVTSVGVTSRLPLIARGINPNPLYPEDDPAFSTKLPPLQIFTTIGGGYLRTLRIPIIAGRDFDGMDSQREGDALVSLASARMFWHDSTGRTALGKRFRALPNGPLYTVVGVVGDTHDSTLATPPAPTVYFPEVTASGGAARQLARTMAIAIRTAGDPAAIVPSVQRIVRELDPTLPVFNAQPLTEATRASTARLQFTILIVGSAAIVTLALGALGLFSVLAYMVTLRRREIGIRIALGALPRSIATATASRGLLLTAVGLVAGLAFFAMAAGALRSFLFGVSPWDPATVFGSVAILLTAALLASWLPARQAALVDPVEALRND
jgi:putative ABC transport system permease protein